MSYITKKIQIVLLCFSVTNKIKLNGSNLGMLGLLLFIFMGRLIIFRRAMGVGARHSCHTGLTDKHQRYLVNFTPLDSLSANGF